MKELGETQGQEVRFSAETEGEFPEAPRSHVCRRTEHMASLAGGTTCSVPSTVTQPCDGTIIGRHRGAAAAAVADTADWEGTGQLCTWHYQPTNHYSHRSAHKRRSTTELYAANRHWQAFH